MNLYSSSLLLFSFGTFLIALLVLSKRKDKVAIHFLLFSISASGWAIFRSFWMTQNYSEETSLLLARTSHVFAVFIPITWLHFVLEFIGKKEPWRHFYLANYMLAILFSILCPTPFLIRGMHAIMDFKYYTSPGPLYYLFTAVFTLIVPYGFYHLIRAYRLSKEQERKQLKYFLFATLIIFAAGSTTLLPVFKIACPLYLVAAMPLYPLLMRVALIRHGLFDSEQIVGAFQRERLAAIGTLAASINHEIRNPLHIIKGFAESHLANLEENAYQSEKEGIVKSKEVLSKVIEQAQRIADIVERFTLFAKQGAKEEACFEEIDLREVFEGVLPLVQHELDPDKIRWVNEIPRDLPPLYAERRHLEEVFFNLIVNACQALKEKGGEIKIEAHHPPSLELRATDAGKRSEFFFSARRANRGSGKGNVVEIHISDTGPGIPSDQLQKIFEPFYTTKASGTGLGLYITKQLVEKNGGRIHAESRLGEWTKFVLLLPIRRIKPIEFETEDYDAPAFFNQNKNLVYGPRNNS